MGTQKKNVYGVFNEFLENSLTKENKIFTDKNFEILLNRYVTNYIGDKKESKGKELFVKLNKKGDENLSFEEKITEQFSANNIFKNNEAVSEEAKQLFGYLMWLQYLPATKTVSKDKLLLSKDKLLYGQEKYKQIKRITGLDKKYEYDGCAGYGMAAMRLDEDLTDLVLLFYELVLKSRQKDNSQELDLEQIKKYIVYWCLDLTEKGDIPNEKEGTKGIRSVVYKENANGRNYPKELLPIHNMLLHLCYPQQYAPIAVSGHKKKIVETFEGLIPLKHENNKEKFDLSTVDGISDDANEYNKRLHIILENLRKEVKDLYGNEYKSLWNVGSDKDYSDVNALKFKKAIILYGPPGTSKTFSSDGLAKNLIFQLEYKTKVTDFLEKDKKDQFKKQIHHLQLHPNYTYEDFIWGYQISGTQTVAKKGYFLRLLDQINDGKTHILILDEINRVDLSRLFGELFSAIENRNKLVDLPVEVEGKSQISIPDNLYIIGTMNEIDFSLERVDFALRRRFSWFFYGYNEDRLKDILGYKLQNKPVTKFDDDMQQKYVKCCSALNKMIDNDTDLGSKYEIGHTFFAELIDIWNDMTKKGIKTVQEILWNISIGPMIEAYLGNCDEENKKKKMDSLKAVFLVEREKDKD